MFTECNCLALGKEIYLPSVTIWHSANNFIFFSSDIEKESVRFGVKVTVELGFDFKTFCIGNREHRLFDVKFW